jgi:uncharacterized protein with ParB-like and HNH nuclease domain
MNVTNFKINDLINIALNDSLMFPEFQRPFVWERE